MLKSKNLFCIFVTALVCVAAQSSTAQNWLTTGNVGTTSSNYIGTSDAQPLYFRTQAVNKLYIATDGKFGFNTTTPVNKYEFKLGDLNIDSALRIRNNKAIEWNASGANFRLAPFGTRLAVGYFSGTSYTTAKVEIHNDSTATTSIVKIINQNNTAATNIKALEIYNRPTLGYGYGVHATAGSIGGYFIGDGSTSTASVYGTYTTASGTGGIRYGLYSSVPSGTNKYGIYSTVTGAGNLNIGLYATATGGTTNWAGYFVGRSYFSDVAGFGTSSPISPVDAATSTFAKAINSYNSFNSTSYTYGAYSRANNSGTGGSVGGYFEGTGASGINYGVYGTATGGTTNWAGYFVQDAFVGGSLAVGASTLSDCKFGILQTGTTSATAKFYNTTKGPNISWVHFDATGDWYIRSAADAGKVVIQDQVNGTVCIGTTAPATGYKLSVWGKIIAEEIKVQLHPNWPDYVFATDYNMPSLDELKLFVNTHKHLPGIPSAEEVKNSNGVELGKMQAQLLEKIEELTLYVIQLGDENKKLSAQLNELSK